MNQHYPLEANKITSQKTDNPKVFISYSHDSQEHEDRVWQLSDRLRAEGVDCKIDQYETSPPEGWPQWMVNKIEEAEYVLVVCTETYERRFKGKEEAGKGLGGKWEGAIITQELYSKAKNTKFIPVVFSQSDVTYIPNVLNGATRYEVSTKEGYEALYRRLTNQPLIQKPELGKLRAMPPRERKRDFLEATWNVPYPLNPFIQEKIKRLQSEAEEIIGLSKIFFASIPIQTENQIISYGSPIPRFEGGYMNSEPNSIRYYSWGELSTEKSEMQVELLKIYDSWYGKTRLMVIKFLSDRLGEFDESHKEGKKYIKLVYPPSKTGSIKSFHEFIQHFNYEQNILSLIFSVVEDDEEIKRQMLRLSANNL